MKSLIPSIALLLVAFATGSNASDTVDTVGSYHVKTLSRDSGLVYRRAGTEESIDERHARLRGAWFYQAKVDPITRKKVAYAEKLVEDPDFYQSKHLGIRLIKVGRSATQVCVMGHGHATRNATISIDNSTPFKLPGKGCVQSETLLNALVTGSSAVVIGYEWHREDPATVLIDLQNFRIALHHLIQLHSTSDKAIG